VNLNLVFTSQGLRVEVYFGSSDTAVNERRFDAVLAKRQEIEAALNNELVWERLDGKKSCRISLEGPMAFVEETHNWGAYKTWLKEAFGLFRQAASTTIVPEVKRISQL
jgi:hypothetical protein